MRRAADRCLRRARVRRIGGGESRVGREFGGDLIEFAPAQRVDEIASEDDPLALPSGQIWFDEMIDPAVHCLPDVCAEAAAAERGLFGEKLTVDPGRALSRDLASTVRSDRVASETRFRSPASPQVRVSTMAPGLASPVISRSEKTRWCVRKSTPAMIGVCRAFQSIVEATLQQPAQHWLAGLVAVKRESSDVGLAFCLTHRSMHRFDDVARMPRPRKTGSRARPSLLTEARRRRRRKAKGGLGGMLILTT